MIFENSGIIIHSIKNLATEQEHNGQEDQEMSSRGLISCLICPNQGKQLQKKGKT